VLSRLFYGVTPDRKRVGAALVQIFSENTQLTTRFEAIETLHDCRQ
jgi:hypothetical protein